MKTMKPRYVGEIKPCPFCGHETIEDELNDSFHPTDMHWFKSPVHDHVLFNEDLDCVHYDPHPLQVVLERDITEYGRVWKFTCLETSGGCGVFITGDSEEEVMRKWNRRV